MAKSPAKPTAAKSKPKAKTGPKPAPVIPRQPGVERRQNQPLRAQNGYMRVILTHKVDKLGGPGDLVKVRPGYARNYLIPQGLATFATPHNVRMVEKHRERLRHLEEAKRADLQKLFDFNRSQRQRRGPSLRFGDGGDDRHRAAC